MRIVITGGLGFIGSALAKKLCREHQVVAFDNGTRTLEDAEARLRSESIDCVSGDILNLEELVAVTKSADVVVHTAAIAGIAATVADPVKTMEVNMLGTANVLKACQTNGVRTLIDFSTSEVFGSDSYNVSELSSAVTGSVGEARWSYAVSKLAGEHLAHAYHKRYGIQTVTVRPFNVYGPGQVGEGAVQIMIRNALRNDPLIILGTGSQIRAWLYIDDMIRALVMILNRTDLGGHVLNIGNSRDVLTIYQLAVAIRRALGSKSEIVFRDALSADIQIRVPDTSKATEILGFTAEVEFEEGIQRTAEWIRANEAMLFQIPAFLKK